MKAVWKFEMRIADEQTVIMPKGAQVLTVQSQYEMPMLWCLCDLSEHEKEERKFRTAGTGHPISQDNIQYIGMFQIHDGDFVAHVFEVIETH